MTVGITDCIYMLIRFLVQFFDVVKGKASELVFKTDVKKHNLWSFNIYSNGEGKQNSITLINFVNC